MLRAALLLLPCVTVIAQQRGTNVKEVHPPLPMQTCDADGTCTDEETSVVLDMNWRWLHGKGGYVSSLVLL